MERVFLDIKNNPFLIIISLRGHSMNFLFWLSRVKGGTESDNLRAGTELSITLFHARSGQSDHSEDLLKDHKNKQNSLLS